MTHSSELICGRTRLYLAMPAALIAVAYTCVMMFEGPLRFRALGWPSSVLRWAGLGSYIALGVLALEGFRVLYWRRAAVRDRRAFVASVMMSAAAVCVLLAQLIVLLIPACSRALGEFWLR